MKKFVAILIVGTLLLSGCVHRKESYDTANSYRRINVIGNTMTPTMSEGEIIKVKDLTSGEKATLKRNDIVTYHYARSMYRTDEEFATSKYIEQIGRIVAVNGDHLEIKNREVYLNGIKLNEQYIEPNSQTVPNKLTQWDIKDGEYFILGDNRARSIDSRISGPISSSAIESLYIQCEENCK